jgi:hypothetical protein
MSTAITAASLRPSTVVLFCGAEITIGQAITASDTAESYLATNRTHLRRSLMTRPPEDKRTQSRTKRGLMSCDVYLPDIEHKRTPDPAPGKV